MQNGKKYAKLKKVPLKYSPGLGENDGKIISTWNLGSTYRILRIVNNEIKFCVSIQEINPQPGSPALHTNLFLFIINQPGTQNTFESGLDKWSTGWQA
jgi:hypothetical protein